VEAVVHRFAAGREITPATTLDELGLSSLDRVEMMMALEEAFRTTLEEGDLARAKTVADLGILVGAQGVPVPRGGEVSRGVEGASGGAGSSRSTSPAGSEPIQFPAWNRWRISWFLRRISLPTWILPLARLFMALEVRGLEHLKDLREPVIFAANHTSHMDGPAVFIALPRRWRYRLAPAMAKEFFRAHFYPAEFSRKAWFTNSLNYYLACLFFNAFPLPQRETGTRQTLRYIGEVVADGYSVLIFPEGRRSDRGEVQPFRPGVAMMGARLGVPIVPVRLEGLEKILHPKMRWPKRGPARVTFGAPIRLQGEDYPALAKQVETAVARLGSHLVS
jgi:long-chain acyl-CoA synthetase